MANGFSMKRHDELESLPTLLTQESATTRTFDAAKAPPRPAGTGAFPRPTAEQAETLRKFREVQAARTVGAREAVRRRFEGATEAEAEAELQARADEQARREAELALKTEPARITAEGKIREAEIGKEAKVFVAGMEAGTATAQRALDEKIANIKAGTDLKIADKDIEIANIDADAKRDVADTSLQADKVVAEINAQGDPTPQQEAQIEMIKQGGRAKVEALSGIASLSEQLTGDEEADAPINRQIALLNAAIVGGNTIQKQAMSSLQEGETIAGQTEQLVATEVAQDTAVADNIADMTEGQVDAQDEAAWDWANKPENKNTIKGRQILGVLKERYSI